MNFTSVRPFELHLYLGGPEYKISKLVRWRKRGVHCNSPLADMQAQLKLSIVSNSDNIFKGILNIRKQLPLYPNLLNNLVKV